MRIVEPSVSFLWGTQDPIKTIERAGRIAYKSEDKITPDSAERFVQIIRSLGHESVVEHASASLLFLTDRGVTHELVRHRLFSFTQESTRYCNYGIDKFSNEITVIKPHFHDVDIIDIESAWYDAVAAAEKNYMHMVTHGVKAQLARSILPNCLKTEIAVTGNVREWRHFLKLRTAKTAHPQMVEVATMAKTILLNWAPVLFEDL